MKAIAHTPFAIFGIMVLFTLFMIPLNSIPEESRIDVKGAESAAAEAYNLNQTFKDGLGISASNYIEASNEYVVNNGFVSDADSATNGFEQGEFNGNTIDFVNYTQWTSNLNSSYALRGNEVEYSFDNLDLEEGLKIKGVADLSYNFSHNSYSTVYSLDARIEGLDAVRGPDPLLESESGGAFTPQYSYCGFEQPATQLGTGSSSSNNISHGYAAVEPQDISAVDHSDSRILVVENASKYSSVELDSFSGVITKEGSIENGNYAEVEGIDLNVTDGTSIIINQDEVWKSHFRKMIDDNCYVKNSNAPGVFDRMEGNFSSSNNGITTFVNDTSGSGNPNEAYIFYDTSTSVTSSGVKGVTSGDYVPDNRPWFELSSDSGNDNFAEWSISSLEN